MLIVGDCGLPLCMSGVGKREIEDVCVFQDTEGERNEGEVAFPPTVRNIF